MVFEVTLIPPGSSCSDLVCALVMPRRGFRSIVFLAEPDVIVVVQLSRLGRRSAQVWDKVSRNGAHAAIMLT